VCAALLSKVLTARQNAPFGRTCLRRRLAGPRACALVHAPTVARLPNGTAAAGCPADPCCLTVFL